MRRANRNRCSYSPKKAGIGCCRVEALVSIDERGQMVLPKETRQKANIGAGDKLALVTFEREGRVCCISLIKVEEVTDMVKSMLGPMTKEILG
ncbi:MAG: AbrB/MazE/SpoVT family DNA-binding domain-containing protein [Chloroflexi bacterium]|nr:AbrB/MazE/SpoVT family DNA-binding domain-containing protein [Chloroflexota bacterium]